MATVRTFEVEKSDNAQPHDEVERAVVRLVDCGNERFIQIDTYGRSTREVPGKLSQTTRLDKAAFDKFVQLGKAHF
ncbi:hypothetical protein GRI72_05625 [Altererythrobacter marinus]|jgi:hypothetical protein|uniref:Methionyl-tRNA formyltransferase n=1 Tax=Pelagerythrobacter marinus TaxID=538382 RepID=A0ABW9UUP1_9SPHN|nr:hypothetical protein [Pelagerythrobacter marinus]MXO68305.1 hypothetical protein [Pelagerythrobacter marinus]